jgi:hypothetical protein
MKKICSDKERGKLGTVVAIFVFLLVTSAFGTSFLVYFLVSEAASELGGWGTLPLDGSTPPYLGLILVGTFIVSWIGLVHTRSLKRSMCREL